MLDVAAIKPQMPGLEEQLLVEGRNETVLASAQILRGKFYRTDKSITRDAFDFAVAADKRPPRPRAGSQQPGHDRDADHLPQPAGVQRPNGRRCKRTLNGVPPEYRHHLKRIGDAAADAVLSHRYAHVRIRTTETGIRIETRASSGNERTEHYAAGESIKALTRSGIGAYLGANSTLQIGGLAMTLDSLNEVGWKGTVFDSGDSAPDERLDDTRSPPGSTSSGESATYPSTRPTRPNPQGPIATTQQATTGTTHTHDSRTPPDPSLFRRLPRKRDAVGHTTTSPLTPASAGPATNHELHTRPNT